MKMLEGLQILKRLCVHVLCMSRFEARIHTTYLLVINRWQGKEPWIVPWYGCPWLCSLSPWLWVPCFPWLHPRTGHRLHHTMMQGCMSCLAMPPLLLLAMPLHHALDAHAHVSMGPLATENRAHAHHVYAPHSPTTKPHGPPIFIGERYKTHIFPSTHIYSSWFTSFGLEPWLHELAMLLVGHLHCPMLVRHPHHCTLAEHLHHSRLVEHLHHPNQELNFADYPPGLSHNLYYDIWNRTQYFWIAWVMKSISKNTIDFVIFHSKYFLWFFIVFFFIIMQVQRIQLHLVGQMQRMDHFAADS